MGDEYGIYYRADLAQARVGQARSQLLFRLVVTAVMIAAVLVAWWLWPGSVASWAPWFIGATVIVGVGYAIVHLVTLVVASREAKLARPGLAIGLNRDGMMVNQRWLPWPDVGSLVVKPGALGGSVKLVATGRGRDDVVVPLDYTDAMPATVDSAVRVLSAGRARVDLSRLA